MSQALQALYAKRAAITGDLDEARAKYTTDPSKGVLERVDNLKRSTETISKEIVAELGHAHARGELGTEDGSGIEPTAVARSAETPRSPFAKGSGRDEALRSIERRSDVLDATSGDRLVGLIEKDRGGQDAEYLAAIADPLYERAFSRSLNPNPGAASLLSPDEARAMQRVGAAMEMRALAIGEGATGGFAIPLALDPTVRLTNGGSVNPLRALASVATITSSEWAGVSSAGVSAAFAPEGTEVGDGSPTLAQPKVKPERAHAFVPFSFEVGGDWSGISGELSKLFADAKENLEAEKMVSGTGTDEPFGIVTGASEVVATATKGTFAEADVYSTQQALPPRFQPQASWLASNTIANDIFRFAGPGSTVPALMNLDRTKILGKSYYETSHMEASVTEAKVIALYGDVESAFKIVDRIGMSVELIPNLLGENGRPTGERGLYAFWRVGSKVVVPNAIRALKVKNT